MLQAYHQVNHQGLLLIRGNFPEFSNNKTRTYQRHHKITEVYCNSAHNIPHTGIKVLIFNDFKGKFVGIIYVFLGLTKIKELLNNNWPYLRIDTISIDNPKYIIADGKEEL